MGKRKFFELNSHLVQWRNFKGQYHPNIKESLEMTKTNFFSFRYSDYKKEKIVNKKLIGIWK